MINYNEAAARLGTDKGSIQAPSIKLSPKGYLDHYVPLMEAIVAKRGRIRILEIGVWKGASLRLWREMFPGDALELTGLDIRWCEGPDFPALMVKGSQGDEYTLECVKRFGPFDCIIDDGGHTHALHKASFEALWPCVAPGGFYAIEDLHAGGTQTIPWLKGRIRGHATAGTTKPFIKATHHPFKFTLANPSLAIMERL